MTFGLKFLFWENRNFRFQNNFRYVFSIAIMYSCETVWVKMFVSKGWCSQKLQYKHYNGKKTNREGVRVKDMEFSGVK